MGQDKCAMIRAHQWADTLRIDSGAGTGSGTTAKQIHKGDNALNDYFMERDVIEFTFYRIPKVLISSPIYRGLSTDAKLLYGLLLDRMGLSQRNGWVDEHGRVYLYCKISAIREDMNCCKEKACKLLSELERFDLVERRRQGRGFPDRIYPKLFCQRSEKQTSGGRNSRP